MQMRCYEISFSPPMYIGGVEVYVTTLIKYLRKYGATPVLITSKPKIQGDISNTVTDTILIESKGKTPTEIFNNFIDNTCQILLEISEQEKDIIIHAHGPIECYAAIKAKTQRDFPLIFTMHDIVYKEWYKYFKKVIDNINSVDGIYTLSNYMRKYLSDYGIEKNKVEVIPGGIDREIFDVKRIKYDEIEKLRKRLGISKQERIIFYPSRIDPLKGIDILIKSLDYINRKYSVKLLLTGGPSLKDTHLRLEEVINYEKRIKTIKNTNVIWGSEILGNINYQDLPALYYLSDITAIPSLSEPFGMVALESMSMGTPVIASNTGGLKEIITDHFNGILITPGDYKELADAIIELIKNTQLHESISKSSYHTAERYSFNNIVKKIIAFYKKLLQ